MGEKFAEQKIGRSLRRRRMFLEGRCFSLQQPLLNLSKEEYDRRLEEIKKMGNMQ